MENSRTEVRINFLAEFFNHQPFEIKALPVDCSYRSYYRINYNNTTFILMDCPPDQEDITSFIRVTEYLHRIEIAAPKIYAVNIRLGLALIEDFGEGLFKKLLLNNSNLQDELYKKAIDLLIYLQKQNFNRDEFNLYDNNALFKEVKLFIEWFYPFKFNKNLSSKAQKKFLQLWENLFSQLNYYDECIVLRDYHVENLMWLDKNQDLQKIGVIDYQDAVIGSYAYDLVSLLEDARIRVGADFRKEMLGYYLNNSSNINPHKLYQDYIILGAQRNCKIMGIFARKALRDNNKNYLQYLPQVWEYICDNIHSPLLQELKEWFLENHILEGNFK